MGTLEEDLAAIKAAVQACDAAALVEATTTARLGSMEGWVSVDQMWSDAIALRDRKMRELDLSRCRARIPYSLARIERHVEKLTKG